MTTSHVCLTCGTSHATASGESLCPVCMLRTAFMPTPEVTSFPITPESLPRAFGPYELVDEIARGGMGIVYKARHRSLRRTVALKVLLGGAYSSESLLRRFQKEAEAAAALQHPGIVAFHEFGEVDHQPYYTMDFVEGRNLSDLAQGQPLEPARAVRYFLAIVEAVSFAHQQGILHRDLKPSNVLIDQSDRPRVADFGLAKRLHEAAEITLGGQMLGSPNYAAPEQAAGRQNAVGVTSDVYSLGALLYYLFTGRPPFLASTVQETLRLVFDTEPVAPRILNPAMPRDLETICLKCLEKDPARRYASAQSLGEELGRFQRHQPILARPISPPEHAWRWGQRHPALAALAATVVVALLGTSAIFYISARRIENARVQERAARLAAQEELYAANMEVTSGGFVAAGGIDPVQLRESLERTRPGPGQRELRGFEWRHFWQRGQPDFIGVFKGHRQVVDTALFSPDGTRVVTRSLDDNLRVWDAASLQEIHSLDGVAVLGGFTTGGGQLIFGRPDTSVWRLDVTTKNIVMMRPAGPRLLAALPDGRHIVVFGPDGLPALRDLAASASMGPEVSAPLPPGLLAVVSADGRRAAIVRPGGSHVLVFDLAARQQLAALTDARGLTRLALSPDGERLVSAGMDGQFKVWDVTRGRTEYTFKAFLDPVWGLSFSPDGRSLAAGGHNRKIVLWDTTSWKLLEELQGHDSTIQCIAFSPDGERLVSGAEDEFACLWPVRAKRLPTEMPRTLRGPAVTARTPGMSFSPDSRLLAGSAADGQMKVWRTDTLECVATFPVNARTLAFSPEGGSLWSESDDGTLRHWSLGTGSLLETTAPHKSVTDWLIDRLTPEQRVMHVAAQSPMRAQCRLCDIPSARDSVVAGEQINASTLATSHDGRTLFFGLPDGAVESWDVPTGERRLSFTAHKIGVTAITVSADGRYVATGSFDNSTRLWDAATGELLATFRIHNRPVWALAFSPDGQTLAAGSCDKSIVLASVLLRKAVARLPLYIGAPEGYEQEVRALLFSPDSNILAASLGDGTVRFFRAAPFSETDRNAPTRSSAP